MVPTLAIVVVAAGCNRVYGLDETRLIDAGAPDGLPQGCHTVQLAIDSDTYLVDGTSRGRFDVVIPSDTHPALFRFMFGPPSGERVAAAILRGQVVDRADECGGSCAACPVGGATTYRAYWNESSWGDDEATRDDRRVLTPWEAPYATGAMDRSELVAMRSLANDVGALELPIRMTDVVVAPAEPWLRISTTTGAVQLTIQLLTDAPLAIASEQRGNSTCNDGVETPTLELTLCP